MGWTSHGPGLPFVNLDADTVPESVLELLTEDLFQVISPDKRYTVDVGFYPEMDPDGVFRCVLIQGDDWENPVKEKEFRNTEDVLCWIIDEVERVFKTIYGGK